MRLTLDEKRRMWVEELFVLMEFGGSFGRGDKG